MAQVSPHPNIVALVGVVTTGWPKMIIVTLCENGALDDYLVARALSCKSTTEPQEPFSNETRLKMATDVVSGRAPYRGRTAVALNSLR